MPASADFIEFVREQLAPLGTITSRRLFSGTGIYADGAIFAYVFDDSLYFKVDAASRPQFEAEGSEPFRYDSKTGPRTIEGIWRAPDRLFDDPDALLAFGREALAAGRRRTAAKVRPKAKKGGRAK